MSVLIKGLTIPTVGVRHCVISFCNDRLLISDVCGNSIFEGNYVEIPTPHGKVIDGDKLVISALEACNRGDDTSIVELIEKLPAIIEAEVSE